MNTNRHEVSGNIHKEFLGFNRRDRRGGWEKAAYDHFIVNVTACAGDGG